MLTEATKFCVIDIETTGLNPYKDEMIAFACIPIHHMRIRMCNTFYTLIKPKRYSVAAMKYHGISQDDLIEAPVFEDVSSKIFQILDGVLVGHSVYFDYSFLKRNFRTLRLKFKREYLDIVMIERWLRQKRKMIDMDLSFDAMIDFYGLKQYYRHNAFADAFFAAQIFQIQMQEMVVLGVDTIDKVIKAVKNCRDTSSDLGSEYVY